MNTAFGFGWLSTWQMWVNAALVLTVACILGLVVARVVAAAMKVALDELNVPVSYAKRLGVLLGIAFGISGFIAGLLTGLSNAPVVGAVVPAVITLVSAILGYVFLKEGDARTLTFAVIILISFSTNLLVATFIGIHWRMSPIYSIGVPVEDY